MFVTMSKADRKNLEPVILSNTPSRKIKSQIVKTYQHEICVSYEGLISGRPDLCREDSDPDETQKMMNELQRSSPFSTLSSRHSNTNSTPPNLCQHTVNHNNSTSRLGDLMTGKRSIGGISTGDSGVVSHDSLLDRCRDDSYYRSDRSLTPSDSPITPPGRLSRGEFDPINRASILDSRYRSRSRGRLEEQQRAKSPCRGNGVKDMINFFEGSHENIAKEPANKEPLLKVPTYTPPLTPLRQARLNSSIYLRRQKESLGTVGTSTQNGDCENVSVSSTADADGLVPNGNNSNGTASKQENVLHLTCVASGYSHHSPHRDSSKSDHEDAGSNSNHHIDNSNTETATGLSETNKSASRVNGSQANGDTNHNPTPHSDGGGDRTSLCTNTLLNGIVQPPSGSGDMPPSNNKCDPDSGVSSDEIAISIHGSTTSHTLTNGVTNGEVVADDEVDRAVVLTTVGDITQTEEKPYREDIKLAIQSHNSEDSPSKKGGEWFLKVTDTAEARLMSLADLAQQDLDTQQLPDEVCGQIRAAIGKAHLLVNKKLKQFRGLCNKNLTQGPDEPFPTTSQDLAGFWDLVSIQVSDCEHSFSDIEKLRTNNWVIVRVPSTEHIFDASKKPITPRGAKSIEVSIHSDKSKGKSSANKQTDAARARNEARKRLMAAKKAMRERRNSESEDMIFVGHS